MIGDATQQELNDEIEAIAEEALIFADAWALGATESEAGVSKAYREFAQALTALIPGASHE